MVDLVKFGGAGGEKNTRAFADFGDPSLAHNPGA
jgi:hypothetical protein